MVEIKGGDRLEAALRDIAQRVKKASTVKVGFMSGATYPSGESVATIAAINEFGAPSRGQPPRPFFRNMIAKNSGQWPSAIAELLKTNEFDAARTLDQAGLAIAGQLQQSIADLVSPPLKPSTIKRKGFDKPLIATGTLLASVTHKVT